mmetsp:Transcript_34838/g.84181  ORF Transcript_34838/g.84181 Transcript_34838/m.84181 type:complete len:519 (+) Transcript_34838:52-1608(+)
MNTVASSNAAKPAKSGEKKPDQGLDLPPSEQGERLREVENSFSDKERMGRRDDMSIHGANLVTSKILATNHNRIPTAPKNVPSTLKKVKALATVCQNQTSTGSKTSSTAKRLQVDIISERKQRQNVQRRQVGGMVEKEQRKDNTSKAKPNKRKATSANADGDDDGAQTDICVVCDANEKDRQTRHNFLPLLSYWKQQKFENQHDSQTSASKEVIRYKQSPSEEVIESQQSAADDKDLTKIRTSVSKDVMKCSSEEAIDSHQSSANGSAKNDEHNEEDGNEPAETIQTWDNLLPILSYWKQENIENRHESQTGASKEVIKYEQSPSEKVIEGQQSPANDKDLTKSRTSVSEEVIKCEQSSSPTQTHHQESVAKNVVPKSQHSAADGGDRTDGCGVGDVPEKKKRARRFLKRLSRQGRVNDKTQTDDAPQEPTHIDSFLTILAGQEQTAVVDKSRHRRTSNNGMKKASWHNKARIKKKRKTKDNETWSEALETLRVGVVDVLNPKGMVDDVKEEWACFWE